MTPKTTAAAPALIETARAKGTAPALFQAVRASKDLSLVAFGAALLTAFTLQAGAFLPRFTPPPPASLEVEPSPEPAAPAFVAARRASRAAPVEAPPAPCELPAAL